jgi:hypothetical protein
MLRFEVASSLQCFWMGRSDVSQCLTQVLVRTGSCLLDVRPGILKESFVIVRGSV